MMDEYFPEQFPISADRMKEIWSEATIVFDTNVLLDAYRYSEHTREEFFRILTSVKNRIWVPFQVVNEFFANRIAVIQSEIKSCRTLAEKLRDISTILKKDVGHPFFSTGLQAQFDKMLAEGTRELEQSIDRLRYLACKSDNIQAAWNSLLAGRIGKCPRSDELELLRQQAIERHKDKIPPGFLDTKRKKDASGDFILWSQMLNSSPWKSE
jgi:predicted nucleic acid-binding protein